MKKESKVLKDEQGNDISSPRLSDNPSEEGEVKVSHTLQWNSVCQVKGSICLCIISFTAYIACEGMCNLMCLNVAYAMTDE